MKRQLLGLLLLHFQLCHLRPPGQILKAIPTIITPLHSSQINIIKTFKSFLDETHAGDKIMIASTYFTNIDIANYLSKTASKGVDISVIIDKASWGTQATARLSNEILMQLKKSNIATYIYDGIPPESENKSPCQMHLKTTIWQHNTSKNKFFRVFSGSANLSTAATKNKELMMFHPNNYKLFNQYKKYFEYIKANTKTTKLFQEKNKQIIDVRLHSSIIKTLVNLINLPTAPEEVKINTYTYNCLPLTRALIKALNLETKIQLIVDKKSLDNQSANQQLRQLSKAGAHVFVWNSKNQIHHAKYCLIKRPNNWNIAEGSANFTYNADNDINQITVHDNNKDLYKILDNISQEIANKCLPLS